MQDCVKFNFALNNLPACEGQPKKNKLLKSAFISLRKNRRRRKKHFEDDILPYSVGCGVEGSSRASSAGFERSENSAGDSRFAC